MISATCSRSQLHLSHARPKEVLRHRYAPLLLDVPLPPRVVLYQTWRPGTQSHLRALRSSAWPEPTEREDLESSLEEL